MKSKQRILAVLGATIFAVLLAGSSVMASEMPPQETETGYLVSLRGHTLAISNVALGGSRADAGQPQVKMMTRGPDGQMRELTGEELEKAKKHMGTAGGTSVSVNVDPSGKKTYSTIGPDGQIKRLTEEEYQELLKKINAQNSRPRGPSVAITMENGKKYYTVTGEDGVSKKYTEEEFEKLREKMHGGGEQRTAVMTTGSGKMTAKADSSEGENSASSGTKVAKQRVAFSRFEIDDQTVIPEDLDRGTKIKVHYRTEGDRKIATRVETIL